MTNQELINKFTTPEIIIPASTDWQAISNERLSEDFIREYQDRLNWNAICYSQTLSEPFIREMKDRVEWVFTSECQTLSESFIREFQDRVNWNGIWLRRNEDSPQSRWWWDS
jgi:hypothetical protein